MNSTAHVSRPRSTRRLGLLGVMTATAAALAVSVGLASPASALVDAGGAYAMETVTCNSESHTVTVDFNVVGFGSGVYGGTDLFPYELQKPVFVKVTEYINGRPITTSWKPTVAGHSRFVLAARGTTYWHFQWAFQTPSDDFEYRNEWAGGAGRYGSYGDQRGYRALNRCYS